jgi:predicted acyl esterase
MIPMRDGVKLFTVILTPETQNENLPIYMERTPYGVAGWNGGRLNGAKPELVKDGYILRLSGHPRSRRFGRCVRDASSAARQA